MASIPGHGSLRIISRSNSISSRDHVSPPHEASTLLSPDQLHRDSPVQKRHTPAIVGDVEDASGTQPLSNSNSDRTEQDARSTSFRRATHWKTVGMIIGFLFAGLLSALGHYFLFRNLNRKLTDTSYLTQTQASAVSILLTTIFKAALTASTGICFAQHLWFVLRGNAMSLSAIEKLFVFRTNILVLGDLRSIWRAPLLFLMALLVWCLGIATIYPPGALIVTFEAHNYTENRNVSILNPPIPEAFNLSGRPSFPTLTYPAFSTTRTGNRRRESRSWSYTGPALDLNAIAKSVVINNQVFTLPVNTGENSTYNIQFRGPQLRCTGPSYYNNTSPLEDYAGQDVLRRMFSTPALVSKWDWDSRWFTGMQEAPLYSITKHEPLTVTAWCPSINSTSFEILRATTELICKPYSVLYDVKVSFPRGIQTIQHTTSDIKPLTLMREYCDSVNSTLGYASVVVVPADAQALEAWNRRLHILLPLATEWALLDALGATLEDTIHELGLPIFLDTRWGPRWCNESSIWTNGSTFSLSSRWGARTWTKMNASTPLKGTVFDTSRSLSTRDQASSTDLQDLDPRTYINVTQDLLNDVLTNLTLSAISLGTWWDKVNVTTTRYQSTYSFAHPLNLIIPYSVCLAVATLFAAVAIWSLWRNGIPVADGGFLQIMVATRGNTEMERLVLHERLTTIENMSAELKSLKIRYGELVGEDVLGAEARRMGFGTVEETASLRKRK